MNFKDFSKGFGEDDRRKILYIEDDVIDQELIRKIAGPGIDLSFETSVMKGINRVGVDHFDFVIIDLSIKEDWSVLKMLIKFLVDVQKPFAVLTGPQAPEGIEQLCQHCWSKEEVSNNPEMVLDTVCLEVPLT
jgi:hypothetical protein